MPHVLHNQCVNRQMFNFFLQTKPILSLPHGMLWVLKHHRMYNIVHYTSPMKIVDMSVLMHGHWHSFSMHIVSFYIRESFYMHEVLFKIWCFHIIYIFLLPMLNYPPPLKDFLMKGPTSHIILPRNFSSLSHLF